MSVIKHIITYVKAEYYIYSTILSFVKQVIHILLHISKTLQICVCELLFLRAQYMCGGDALYIWKEIYLEKSDIYLLV